MVVPEPASTAGPVAGAAYPVALSQVASRVEGRVDGLLTSETTRWRSVSEDLGAPLAALRDLVRAGGKRLRPVFCHTGFVGAGGDPEDPSVLDAAAALELVHTFALIHDDVMDGSDTRRGLDAVHRRFVDRHRVERWHGESRRFGEGMAILVGDFALVYADRLMRGAPATALDVYDELRVELCVGQSLDLLGAARRPGDLETARRIAVYKSAKYTVERPLHLGAALADRLEDLAGPLSAVGLPLGEAFQLRDDVLGVLGDAAATGKPVGDDLREGKPTPLLAMVAARLHPRGHPLLERLGAPDIDDAEIRAFQDLLVSTGVLDEVEARIGALVDEARAAIERAPLRRDARTRLHDLATYVAWRDR